MSLKEIKSEMKNYRDFYGGDISCVDRIDSAETKEELCKIIDEHWNLMEMMLRDAGSHLDNFKKRIGLTDY